jgi:hypothetical protein
MVRFVYTVTLEREPWFFPANDPVTEAVPRVLGRVNPSSPALFCRKVKPENVPAVEWIDVGLHVKVACKA